MRILQSRRQFLASASTAAAAAALGARSPLADEPPPEVTTIRLRRDPSICVAPWYVAEDLLRAEGFADVRYVPVQSGPAVAQMISRGEIDFALGDVGSMADRVDAGIPITVLAGVHAGCFELFAHEPVRTISELKGKKVGIDILGSGKHRLVAVMAAYVGLDPHRDIDWVEGADINPMGLFPMQLFTERKVDAFLAFPPEPQELRARGTGHVILNLTTDLPWSQYFCCMMAGNRNFVEAHPVATKRVLRAVLKANGVCASEPERVARRLVNDGYTQHYDYALQTLTELPFASWRDFDPEDSLRFYALRLHEVGMVKSSPNKIIADGTDWRFLNELKRELKA